MPIGEGSIRLSESSGRSHNGNGLGCVVAFADHVIGVAEGIELCHYFELVFRGFVRAAAFGKPIKVPIFFGDYDLKMLVFYRDLFLIVQNNGHKIGEHLLTGGYPKR